MILFATRLCRRICSCRAGSWLSLLCKYGCCAMQICVGFAMQICMLCHANMYAVPCKYVCCAMQICVCCAMQICMLCHANMYAVPCKYVCCAMQICVCCAIQKLDCKAYCKGKIIVICEIILNLMNIILICVREITVYKDAKFSE